MTTSHRHAVGIARREFLQVGVSGLIGLGLTDLLAARASAKVAPRAKAMILVFQSGGCSHIDTWDPKPNAPEQIRGEFRPTATKVPGIQIGEHTPMLAARMDKLAIVRSLHHEHTNHLNATHQILTGRPQPGAFFDKIASRDDFPNFASGLDFLKPRADGIPSGVLLPTFLMEGPLVWPGQHAGFLGPKHDPWQIKGDPNAPDFKVESLGLPEGFSVERLRRRRDLLGELAGRHESLSASASTSKGADPLAEHRELAYSLMLSGRVARAFDLKREDPKVRDRYGRNAKGQSLLLARRLIQAGVPIVQANMGRVQEWDTHSGNFKGLKNHLLPPVDRGVSALLDDLESLGMLDETLVILTGEFGRTPRIGSTTGNVNGPDGRDHWSACFSAVFAGGGVRGGQVIGSSDKNGAYPASRPYSPADFAATIYRALGVDPASEVHDRLGRPVSLCPGQEIAPLFSGGSA